MKRLARWGFVAASAATVLLMTVAPSASAATSPGSGTFNGYSDETNGYECRTAKFAVDGTLTVGYRHWDGPFAMAFNGCPDGVNPGPDVLHVSGTDTRGRKLTGTCGVYTHDCRAAIVPVGATAQYFHFHLEYSYTSKQTAPGFYVITGTYRES
jgi:hypothetical protein